jgi:glycerol-3-phosphate dehydrogenase (NAD(P)+)
MNVTVLGAGAWGTALGLLLDQNEHQVTLWGHDPARLDEMARERTNDRHLPGVVLPDRWLYQPDLTRSLAGADTVIMAVPSVVFRAVAARMDGYAGCVVSVTKGIEFSTGLTMTGILEQVLPRARLAALSGPSLAMEVARGIPSALVAASRAPEVAREVQQLFHRPTFRVYRSTDLTGVELGGALKNVMAIAAGVCDGLQFGDNAKAALITRGKAEMQRLGVACGALAETFSGLSGLGDLTVTCFSRLSRNRALGERLGRGETALHALEHMHAAVEGYPTTKSARELATRLGVEAPITDQVYAMLYDAKEPARAVRDLLSRDIKAED